MYWHIDTDIISLVVMSAIYLYSLQAQERAARDMQARKFLWCLLVGIVVTVVDILASVAMEVPVSRFLYHLMMSLDFLGLELTIVFWLRYCLVLLYFDDEKRRYRNTRIVEATYLVYALFVVTNPWTGAIYSLDANNVYRRGPLFFLMTVVYILYALVLFALVLKRRKRLPAGYPAYPLLLTPVIVGASIAAQLLTPGWLMILPGYTLSMVLAFLFLQTRREKERESAEQLYEIMRNVSGGICASAIEEGGKINILLANDTYYSLLGYTREQYAFELDSPLDVVFPADRAFAMQQVRNVIDTRGRADYEYRIVRRDGALRNIRTENSITSIPGMGDTVLLAMLSDITQLKLASEAARVHGEEMRLAMAQMGKMICEYSFDTRTLNVPTAYAAQFGTGTEFNDVTNNEMRKGTIDPAYWEAYQAFHRAIRSGDETGELEMRTTWADGTSHWEHGTFHTIFDSMGTPVKAIIAVEDTTEQHRRYELEQSRPSLGEENLLVHALFNLTANETLDYAYHDGSEVPNSERLCFASDDAALKRLLINERERRAFAKLNDREALLARFEAGETELSIDYRRRLGSGDIVWARNILRMVREPGGSDVLLFEYCYNIEVEKTHELMYNALVDENFDFVGRINVANGHFDILTSSSAADALPPFSGDDLDEMVRSIAMPYTHPDDREAVQKTVNIKNIVRELAHKDSFQFTYRLMHRDGAIRYKVLSMYYFDRERQLIVITREDVSNAVREEMKKNAALTSALAEAEQASRAKSRFLSRMSHELRTPMNVIFGTTELANIQQGCPPQMQDACRAITSSARYLLSLINDILEISRIEGGKVALSEAPFALAKLISSVNEIIEPQAQEKGLIYSAAVDDDMEAAYVGDMTKLQHLLINLLDNAVKFTPANGRVTLRVECAGMQGKRARLRFIVADTGVGIDEAFIPHLFELFAQESAENTTTVTGTGLGLAIAKNLAELMHGDIAVQSVKGKGSTFVVEVALKVATGDVPTATEHSEIPDLTGRRILIVEDNAMNAMILSQLLEKVGAVTVTAGDGQQGVDAFFDSPIDFFDAILMDIRMPVMDGLTATKCIRSLARFDGRAVPIIAVSANAFDEDVALSLQSGMNAHLAKPVETAKLLATLVRYMQ